MQKKHLPVFGVGPLCGASMVLFFVIGVLLHHFGFLASGRIEILRLPLVVLGVAGMAFGVWIWVQAVLVTRINRAILENQLVTTGVYSWVRNPIYTAIAMVLTGAALLFGNLWLLFLPLIFWLDITVLMKATEEKWLADHYGKAYLDYCKRVNRCIPWFPKHK